MSKTWAIGVLAMAWGLSACATLPPSAVFSDSLTAADHKNLGDVYLAQGERKPALIQYQAALDRDSHFFPALLALGNMFFEAHEWGKAAAYFKRALKASPHDAGASNNLAMVYLAEGDHLDQAKQLIAQTLPSAGPLTPYLLDTSASLALREGQYAQAKLALDQAEACAPQNDPDFENHLQESRRKWLEATRARGI